MPHGGRSGRGGRTLDATPVDGVNLGPFFAVPIPAFLHVVVRAVMCSARHEGDRKDGTASELEDPHRDINLSIAGGGGSIETPLVTREARRDSAA